MPLNDMTDEGIIRHPRLRSLALSTLIVVPLMGAIAGYAVWWGWLHLHLSDFLISALIAASSAAVAVMVRVVYSLATDFGVRVDDQGVQVVRRRIFGSPLPGARFGWEELGEPYLLSKVWREIAIPTRGPLLTLSPGQAKVLLAHPLWRGYRALPEDVSQLLRRAT